MHAGLERGLVDGERVRSRWYARQKHVGMKREFGNGTSVGLRRTGRAPGRAGGLA